MEREISLTEYLRVIIKWRKVIIFNVVAVTLLTVVVSLILPARYTATATLLPPVEQPEMLGVSSLLGAGGLGGVARMAGLTGMATASDVFAKILTSRKVMKGIIQRWNLMDVYGVENMEEALLELGGATTVEISSEGLISIYVVANDPQLATNIANSYVDELDKFNREVNMTRGKKNRIFIEGRLVSVEEELRAAEESLKVFQQRHKTVSLEDEVRAAIEAVSDLKAQIIAKQVQLGILREYATDENPQVKEVSSQITHLNRQLEEIEYGSKSKDAGTKFGAGFSVPFAELPAVGLELARLTRDAKIQEVVFELLTEQYEQAKIMEARDTPTVQILDRAVPPEKRSFPQRKRLVLVGFVFSAFVGVGLSFFFEYVGKVQEKPVEYQKWTALAEELKRDIQSFNRRLFRT